MYEGVAILASNLRQNLDESFVRRLAFTVHFPFPDEEHRRRIWRTIWPKEAPLDPGLDFDFLASQFKLSGGNIKNVALAAAFAAAEGQGEIRMRHVAVALEREYQKMSKPLSKEQFGRYAAEVDW
jgi:ATP-dependent 26S proteasome regulatory subunit